MSSVEDVNGMDGPAILMNSSPDPDITAVIILERLDNDDRIQNCQEIAATLSADLDALSLTGRETDINQIRLDYCMCRLMLRATIINVQDRGEEPKLGRFSGVYGFSDGSEFPDPNAFSKDDLVYFRGRAEQTTNTTLKARYCDFLVEKGELSSNERPNLGFLAIDAYLKVAALFGKAGGTRHLYDMVLAMDAACYLSIKLQSKDRVNNVTDTLVHLIGELERPLFATSDVAEPPFNVGRSVYDMLQILLHIRRSKKFGSLVSDSNVIWVREKAEALAGKSGEAYGQVLGLAQEAARLLGDEPQELALKIRRAAALVTRAEDSVKSNPPQFMVAAKFYEDATKQYLLLSGISNLSNEQRADFKARAQDLKLRIRKMYQAGLAETSTFSSTIEIPMEQLNHMVDVILAPSTLTACLDAVAREGALLPSLEIARDLADSEMSEGLLLSLMPMTTIRDDISIEVAESESERVKLNIDKNLLVRISINSAAVLRALFRGLQDRRGLTAESFCDYLAASDLFDTDNLTIIQVGLERYFAADYISMLHILVPQYEDSLRSIIEQGGQGVVSPRRDDLGWNVDTFGKFFDSELVKDAMPEDMRHYIRIIMVEPTGWNLRNRIAHGLIRPQDCTEVEAVTVLHLYLLLTLFRNEIQNDTDHTEMGPDTAS